MVIPEEETGVGKFQLEIESRWVKLNRLKMESGFAIIFASCENEFNAYLGYLADKGEIKSKAWSGLNEESPLYGEA